MTEPTAEHPVRVEFWGDEVTEMRMFSVADQRSIPELDAGSVVAVPCRELLLTDEVRSRAAELGRHAPRDENRVSGGVGDMLAKIAATFEIIKPTAASGPTTASAPASSPMSASVDRGDPRQ